MPENGGPLDEAAEQPAAGKTERVAQRMEEADEVSALLTEAFGSDALEKEKEEGQQAAYEGGPSPGRGPAGLSPAVQPRRLTHPLHAYSALYNALKPLHLTPEILLAFVVILSGLWLLSFPWRLLLGAAGVLMLLTAMGLKALDLLAVAGILLLSWEVADIARQWDRLTSVIERLF